MWVQYTWMIVSSSFILPCGLWAFLWRVSSTTSSSRRLWSRPCDLLGQWDISVVYISVWEKALNMLMWDAKAVSLSVWNWEGQALSILWAWDGDRWNRLRPEVWCKDTPVYPQSCEWEKYRLAFRNPPGFWDYLLRSSVGVYVLLWTNHRGWVDWNRILNEAHNKSFLELRVESVLSSVGWESVPRKRKGGHHFMKSHVNECMLGSKSDTHWLHWAHAQSFNALCL